MYHSMMYEDVDAVRRLALFECAVPWVQARKWGQQQLELQHP